MKQFLKRSLARLPGVRAVDRYLTKVYTGYPRRETLPRGHFASPLPSYDEVNARASELFRKDVDQIEGIRLRAQEQLVLAAQFAHYDGDFPWSDQPSPAHRYHTGNGWFSEADAFAHYAILRHFQPRRIIEIGSGFSSALVLDTNERFLNRSLRMTFIEPLPERLLSVLGSGDTQVEIVRDVVQHVPMERFRELEKNDILFIDSSHVAKIGSDVNHLLFEVLPRLQSGCLIHIHDIFWPFEYPKEWIDRGWAWNEAYMVRAFLQFNTAFDILFFNDYLATVHHKEVETACPRLVRTSGGSLWLVKC